MNHPHSDEVPASNDTNISTFVRYDSESLDANICFDGALSGTAAVVEQRYEFATSIRILTPGRPAVSPVRTKKVSKSHQEYDLSEDECRQYYEAWDLMRSKIEQFPNDLTRLQPPKTPSPRSGSRIDSFHSNFLNELDAVMNEAKNKQKDLESNVNFLSTWPSMNTEQEEIRKGDRGVSSVAFDESKVEIIGNDIIRADTEQTENNITESSSQDSCIVVEEISCDFTDSSDTTLVLYSSRNSDGDSIEGSDETVSYSYLHGPDDTENWQQYIDRKTKEIGDKYDQYKQLLEEYNRKKEDQLERLTDIECNDQHSCDCDCKIGSDTIKKCSCYCNIGSENMKCSESAMETILLLENSDLSILKN